MRQRPPPRAALVVGALGRKEVGGAIAWLRLVQLLGDPEYVRARYPHLEVWVARIVDLHPGLLGPFYFGVTLLIGDPARSATVDELLQIAEARAPEDFRFPMERGVLAYFGRFDALGAAAHFERAAKKPNAPEFIGALAGTLRRRGIACSSIASEAASVAQGDSVIGNRTIACVKHRIEAATVAARLNSDPDDSVEVLIKNGHLPSDVLISGVCWDVKAGTATPRPCR